LESSCSTAGGATGEPTTPAPLIYVHTGPRELDPRRRRWRTHDLSLCVGDLDPKCSIGVLTTPCSGSRPRGQRRRARDIGLPPCGELDLGATLVNLWPGKLHAPAASMIARKAKRKGVGGERES
jgi:hypothetical protein